MKIKFYVIKCDSSLHTCFLVSGGSTVNAHTLSHKTSKTLPDTSRIFFLNSYGFYLFLNELNCCPRYHLAVARHIKSSNTPFVVQLIPNRVEWIDRTWGEIVRVLVWEQLETDHMMSWLSTLGGAFSALGDYFDDRANIAGKISIHQMKLAVRSGDPGVVSRCLLYLSIAYIQKHRFKAARFIISSQYQFAKQTEDNRLTKMCLGIWSKLQYTYKIARLQRKSLNGTR